MLILFDFIKFFFNYTAFQIKFLGELSRRDGRKFFKVSVAQTPIPPMLPSQKHYLKNNCIIFFIDFLFLGIILSHAIAGDAVTQQKNNLNVMIIRGIIDEKENMMLYPIYSSSDSGLDWPDGKGPFNIEIVNGEGHVVKTYRFGTLSSKIITKNGSDRPMESGMFAFKIEYFNEAEKLIVKRNEKICASVVRSTQSPEISLIRPGQGDTLSGEFIVEWRGRHKQITPLYYLLEYSATKGETWMPILGLTTETSFLIDTKFFAPSHHIILRLICTDGFNTVTSDINVKIQNPVTIQYTIPYDREKNVTLTPTLCVRFTNCLKKNQIYEKTFVLLESDLSPIMGAISYDSDSRIGQFVPHDPLKPDTVYMVYLKSGIEDNNGNKLLSDYRWSFTTKSLMQKP